MIRAELKGILCWDEPNGDFSAYRPDDPKNFSCALELLVCIHNEDGKESFRLTICTPQWLIQNHSELDIVVGKNLLIAFDFNRPRFIEWLNRFVERCTGETWSDVAQKVARISAWEFDNYRP